MMNRLGIGLLVIGVLLASTNFIRAEDVAKPQVILLWPQGAPGAVGNEEKDKPSLTVYLPPADTWRPLPGLTSTEAIRLKIPSRRRAAGPTS